MEGVENAPVDQQGFSWIWLLKKTLEKIARIRALRLIRHGSAVWEKEGFSAEEGLSLYNYQTLILEDFIEEDWKISRDRLDEATKGPVDKAYQEVKDHVGLNWD